MVATTSRQLDRSSRCRLGGCLQRRHRRTSREIDTWVLLLGARGFVVGIALLGRRTIETVGGKITKLTPSRSFSVQMGTAVAVLSSTMLGLAVSTSHCLVGAVIGVGMVGRLVGEDSELNVSMLKKIVVG